MIFIISEQHWNFANVGYYVGTFNNSPNYQFAQTSYKFVEYVIKQLNLTQNGMYQNMSYNLTQIRIWFHESEYKGQNSRYYCGYGIYFPQLQKSVFNLLSNTCPNSSLDIEQSYQIAKESFYGNYRFEFNKTKINTKIQDCTFIGVINHTIAVTNVKFISPDYKLLKNIKLLNQSYLPTKINVTYDNGYFNIEKNTSLISNIVSSLYFLPKTNDINFITKQQQITIMSTNCNIKYNLLAHEEVTIQNQFLQFILLLSLLTVFILGLLLRQINDSLDLKLNLQYWLPLNSQKQSIFSFIFFNSETLFVCLEQLYLAIALQTFGSMDNSAHDEKQRHVFNAIIQLLIVIFWNFFHIQNVLKTWKRIYNFELQTWIKLTSFLLLGIVYYYLGVGLGQSINQEAVLVFFFVTQLKWFFGIIKIFAQPYIKYKNLKYLFIRISFLTLMQLNTFLVLIQMCSSFNFYEMIGFDQQCEAYFILSCSLNLLFILVLIVKHIISKNKYPKYDVSETLLSYKFLELNAIKELDQQQLCVAIPFQKPKQVCFTCHNPSHPHSMYFQHDFSLFLLKTNNTIQPFKLNFDQNSKCFQLIEFSKLKQTCCICLEDILLSEQKCPLMFQVLNTDELEVNDDQDENLMKIAFIKQEEGESNMVCCGCGHLFHKECLYTWLQTQSICPVCKQSLIE